MEQVTCSIKKRLPPLPRQHAFVSLETAGLGPSKCMNLGSPEGFHLTLEVEELMRQVQLL